MTPSIRPHERRRFTRFNMTTRDCRLTLLRARGGRREAENFTLCILVDLSYKLLGLALPCTQSDS